MVAVFVVLGMGVAYTALDLAQPAQPWQALLTFLPGTLSVLALSAAGCSYAELYLRLAPLSRSGAVVLAAVFVLLLSILGSSTGWTGWEWLPALLYAPASGVAQELYCRRQRAVAGGLWLGLAGAERSHGGLGYAVGRTDHLDRGR